MREKSSSEGTPHDAASSFLSGVLSHDRDISVGLVSYHLPASSKARQNRSFGSALCQQHEAMTFLSLSPALRPRPCLPRPLFFALFLKSEQYRTATPELGGACWFHHRPIFGIYR